MGMRKTNFSSWPQMSSLQKKTNQKNSRVNYFSGDSSKQWIDHTTCTPWNVFLFSKSLVQLFGNLINWNKRSSSDHKLWGESVVSAILLYWPLDHPLFFLLFSLYIRKYHDVLKHACLHCRAGPSHHQRQTLNSLLTELEDKFFWVTAWSNG